MSGERRPVFSPPTGSKRDSLAAELERDPQLSTAKRQQRAQTFTSHMAHAALERQLLAAQTSKVELESKLREREMQIEKLERDRRWLADREQEEREEKERERAEFQEQAASKDQELRTLRSNLTALREEFDELKDTHATLSRTSAQTIASQKSQITTLTRQSTLLEGEVTQFRLLAEERSQTLEEIQGQLDEMESVPRPIADQEEKDMHISEVTILRERHTSIEVLREENRSLERKLRHLEELEEKVIQLEAQLEAGRRQRETWARNQPEPSSSSATPISLTHSLSALRLQHAQLLEDHGATTALLRAKEAELANVEGRVTETQDAIEKLENQTGILKDKLSRAELRAELADREVGFMKALVSSYSLEEANAKAEDTPTTMDSARVKQVEQLESLLETYKVANLKLSQQLNEAVTREPLAVSQGRQHELEVERAARLEAQKSLEAALSGVDEQLKKIEQLEQELYDLSGEIAGGRHVPPGVRVLSFADTPELLGRDNPQARKAEIDKVKEENAALIQRIEALERGGAHLAGPSTSSAIPKESWDAVCQKRDELEALVQQKTKRLSRLKEVYQSKAKEFRDSVESLLGVKLAFFQSGQVRVSSLFDLDTTFVFKPAADGGTSLGSLQLTGTGEDGFEDCEQLMAFWVNREQCIPGFLASVTLELYERKKQREKEGL
ncbi:spindle assembly checkpoint component Mad1 [Mycena amicta]|nr:spindle assembly checkpoint component Mad1 [Mycena amicta]